MKVTCSFNGSKFNGFQKQANQRSVQQELEEALSSICKEEIKIIGCGRTDAGVHGLNYVFNFKTSLDIDSAKWIKAINSNVSDDIFIKNVELVDDEFHSRFSAKSKTYEYRLNIGDYDPINKDYVLQYNKNLDVDKMQKAANLFIGCHDFYHFCSNSIDEVPSFSKSIYSFDVTKVGSIIYFRVSGSGFLRYQVRMMVAALMGIGSYKLEEGYITSNLDNQKSKTQYNIPGCGLYLVEVKY